MNSFMDWALFELKKKNAACKRDTKKLLQI